jgi:hypothetical protein
LASWHSGILDERARFPAIAAIVVVTRSCAIQPRLQHLDQTRKVPTKIKLSFLHNQRSVIDLLQKLAQTDTHIVASWHSGTLEKVLSTGC